MSIPEFIKDEFEKAKDGMILRIHIDLLREDAKLILSRLMTIDPEHASAYEASVRLIP